ncbi:shikimate kinase [Natronincola ferrireducens]|uniref:Shikimate kinase n=1 Tax=Natronincola ferrireducens TaxID=393762 RepID=A0A1G8Y2V2_9FIRM|nr:shikimate kinase [Natronincola ferrireducens]SDJ96764.1 shikimate kinase [Natronincola ferrireducens]
MDIEELRKEIDGCDMALVEIFQRRMKLVLEILENKRKNNLPVLHPQREEEIIEKVLKNLKEDTFAHEVEDLLMKIFKISRRIQSEKLFPHNIVLIGFMGVGKSTIGRDLSRQLEMKYVDTDQLIEERVGMPIKEIFEKYGQAFFRDLEKNIIEEVSGSKNKIIICGGGVVLNPENIRSLRRYGKTILLKAKAATIYDRISQEDSRPVLKGRMSLEGIEQVLQQRDNAYHDAADIIIETDNKPIEKISTDIITGLYEISK